MPEKLFELVEDRLPKGFAAMYRMEELFPIERKFKNKHHPSRNSPMLYDQVKSDLAHGRIVHFPLGVKRNDRPCGIFFSYENQKCMLLLPDPMGKDSRVFLCVQENCSEDTAHRAGAHAAYVYGTEYRRFYPGRKVPQ